MALALVTGGTSGIGAAFARQLASEGYDLILVARTQDRLDAIVKELSAFDISIETIAADLSTDHGVSLVEKRLLDSKRTIDLLVNNAGFGLKGAFTNADITDHERMIRVNVTAVVRLTHAALQNMVKQKSGGIINISSVAGFTPSLRPSSTYAATKAFVTAFSEGLSPTLRKDGVTITAVCPGFVRSEFHERAGISMSKLPKFLWLEPETVVTAGLKDHRSGKPVTTIGWPYKIFVIATRIVPPFMEHRFARFIGKRAS